MKRTGGEQYSGAPRPCNALYRYESRLFSAIGGLARCTRALRVGKNLDQWAFWEIPRTAFADRLHQNAFHRLQIGNLRADLRHMRGSEAPNPGTRFFA